MNKKHVVKGTRYRNLEQAKQARTGPYEDYTKEIPQREFEEQYLNQDTDITAELGKAQKELRDFCDQNGHPVKVETEQDEETGIYLYGFNATAGSTSTEKRINEAGDLLTEVTRLQDKLKQGSPTAATLARIFRTGQLFERWRAREFNQAVEKSPVITKRGPGKDKQENVSKWGKWLHDRENFYKEQGYNHKLAVRCAMSDIQKKYENDTDSRPPAKKTFRNWRDTYREQNT